jgi:hypothetical protein
MKFRQIKSKELSITSEVILIIAFFGRFSDRIVAGILRGKFPKVYIVLLVVLKHSRSYLQPRLSVFFDLDGLGCVEIKTTIS